MLCFTVTILCLPLIVADWRSEVLERHNRLRSKVSQGQIENVPSAKFMARMIWNDSLATQAQAYADKCIWQHDSARGKGVGENLAQFSRASDYVAMVDSWFNENLEAQISDYNSITTEELHGPPAIGHYTQMIWHTSKQLGCGFRKNCTGNSFGMSDMGFLVCRYFPAGNYPSRPIFETGPTCEKCDGTCNEGLCDGDIKGGACIDKYSNCATELFKYCSIRAWVAKDCTKTCTEGKCDGIIRVNTCTDIYSNCKTELINYCCSKDWVKGNCSATCTDGKCDNVIRVTCCVDKFSNCGDFIEYCDQNQWKEDCPKTCQIC